MSTSWALRGQVDASSITHIAISPSFSQDKTLLVGTLAGVSVSRDAGASWETPARGIVGPFIRDVALSPTFAVDGVMYATAPGGFFRSPDRGREWQAATQASLSGLLAIAPDGTLYLVPDGDTCVWRGAAAGRCEPVGHLPGVPLTLAADAVAGILWAITEKGVTRSHDGGSSWHQLNLPAAAHCQALATCGPESVAVGTEETGVLLYRRDGAWELPATVSGLGVTALAASHDGATVAAGTQEGVFISSDAGRTWAAPTETVPVLSLAMTPDAGYVFAGLAGGGCHRLANLGSEWKALPGIGGALIADLHAKSEKAIVRTVDGIIARSGDGGRTWSMAPLSVPAQAVAVAADTGDGFAVATDDGVMCEGLHLRPPVRAEIRGLAIVDDPVACPLIAVADAGEVVLSGDRGETWTSNTPVLETGQEIVEIAFGRPGTQAGPLLAVATLAPDGMGELWLRTQEGTWRRSVAHHAGAAGVHLAAVGGPRGIFFAAGATIYRPARVGALVFSGESLGSLNGGSVLQLAAIREPSGTVTLAALSTGGVYLSRDGGLSWSEHPTPGGPPITAIALRPALEAVEVLVTHVGGSVSAASVGFALA